MLERLDKNDQLCVSLQQVKAQLRLDHADDDEYLVHLISAGTQWVENYLEQCLLKQTWRWTLKTVKHFKQASRRVKLPKSPVFRLVKIVGTDLVKSRELSNEAIYWDENHQTFSASSLTGLQSLEIVFDIGYGDRPDHVPADIRQAILNYVTCVYEQRTGIERQSLLGLYDLLRPYREVRLV